MEDSLSSSQSVLPSPNMYSSTPSFSVPGSGVGVGNSYEEDDACSVCLEPFSAHDPPAVTICKHEYHLQCILEWSQRSKECPICWRQLVLKDPSSQELLVAVDAERKLRSRITAVASHVNQDDSEEFDAEQDSYSDDSDFDERIMQHFSAATSRTHYIRRRDVQPFGGRPSHAFIFSPTSDMANQQAFASLEGGPNASSESQGIDSPTPEMPTADRLELGPSVASPARNVVSSGAINNGNNSCKHGVAFWRALAESQSPGRPGSSEMPTFSESIKSKWSTASARYKDSITKGARGMKEKLLSRNNSVKELSKGVQKEMSAGVARMFERLDLTLKRAGTGPADEGTGGMGSPLKGKGLLQEIDVESMEKKTLEVAHDADQSESSFVPKRSQ